MLRTRERQSSRLAHEGAFPKKGVFRRYHIIYADVLLPEQSGTQFLKELRRRGVRSPVIMITGLPNKESRAELLALGALGYIPKPIKHESLLRATRTALDGGKGRPLSEELTGEVSSHR